MVCGRYTLSGEKCPICGGPVKSPHPPNINLQDKYINTIMKLRREMIGNKHSTREGRRP